MICGTFNCYLSKQAEHLPRHIIWRFGHTPCTLTLFTNMLTLRPLRPLLLSAMPCHRYKSKIRPWLIEFTHFHNIKSFAYLIPLSGIYQIPTRCGEITIDIQLSLRSSQRFSLWSRICEACPENKYIYFFSFSFSAGMKKIFIKRFCNKNHETFLAYTRLGLG